MERASYQESLPDEVGEADLRLALCQALAQKSFGTAVADWLSGDQRLSPAARQLLAAADRVARAVADETRMAAGEALEALAVVGIDAHAAAVPERLQHGIVQLSLHQHQRPPAASVLAAIAALARAGFRPHQPLSEDGWPAYIGSNRSASFIRVDALTTRLHLAWAPEPAAEGSSAFGRLTADLRARSLPAWTLPAYLARRIVRAVKVRLKGQPTAAHFAPYLGTPPALIGPVLALAAPTPDELLLDIGCGDGRVLIEAVKQYGCRARGYETDPSLAAQARAAAAASGLASRIEVIEADAQGADVSSAGVVFLFLPASTASSLLRPMLDVLPPSGRIVAHEQVEHPWVVPPDESALLLADPAAALPSARPGDRAGVTVAHLWRSASARER